MLKKVLVPAPLLARAAVVPLYRYLVAVSSRYAYDCTFIHTSGTGIVIAAEMSLSHAVGPNVVVALV
eukprot:COSAG03_NODE_3485_length_1986_cov_4.533121_2_plen_67_part_00